MLRTSPALRHFRPLLAALLVLGGLLSMGTGALAQETSDVVSVEILPLDGYIDPPSARAILDVIAGAEERDSHLVIIQLDTEGGLSVDGEELVSAIRDADVPVAVYIGPRIAGASAQGLGYVLLTAAPINGAAQDAILGNGSPADLATDDPEGDLALWRDAAAARALDDDLLDAVLWLDEDLAAGADANGIEAGVVDVIANDLQALLLELDGRTVTLGDGREVTLSMPADSVSVTFHSLGLVRRALHASATPSLVYFLLIAGLGLLLFEWFQPGFGVAGIAGLIVLPIAVYGLAVMPVAWWALLLLLAGMGLLALDVARAGLGLPTALGTAALIAGSVSLYDSPHLGIPGWLITLTIASAVVFFTVIITIVLRAQAGPGDGVTEDLVGQRGVVRSVLNPEGHTFIDGALWRSRWAEGERKVPVGTVVRVTGIDGAVLLVGPDVAAEDRPTSESAAPSTS